MDYINVKENSDRLGEMLTYSDGTRKVPVIVEDGSVTIGYKGRS